eukprot:6189809-Pleurochrysis_carterae.AAC.3
MPPLPLCLSRRTTDEITSSAQLERCCRCLRLLLTGVDSMTHSTHGTHCIDAGLGKTSPRFFLAVAASAHSDISGTY